MPVTEQYQVDLFAIIVLIAAVLILVFLIIAAVYFMNLMNLKPPTTGESTFLFWTSLILIFIFVGIIIYAMIRIFTYKSIVYEEPQQLQQQPQPQYRPPPPETQLRPINQEPRVVTTRATNKSLSFSDAPITEKQRNSLNDELISIGNSMGT